MRVGTMVRGAAIAACVAMTAGAASAEWGAVGIDTTGDGYGWSAGYTYESDAYNRVWNECGGYCDQIFTFYNECAAISQASNGAWGWSTGGNRGSAESGALSWCRQYGGRDCYIRVWACSG